MRPLYAVLPGLLFVLTVAPARAQAPGETPTALDDVDADALPETCRALADEANAKALVRALDARITLASCLADEATRGLDLIDGEESVLALDDAIAPSRALLDEVIERGAPGLQLQAQRAIAGLYAGVASRMLQTVPRPAGHTDEAQVLRDVRLANVETMIAPWREAETQAYAAIVKLAAAYPRLARDRAYAATIATSRARAATR
jgi:hypothetical protein